MLRAAGAGNPALSRAVGDIPVTSPDAAAPIARSFEDHFPAPARGTLWSGYADRERLTASVSVVAGSARHPTALMEV